MKKILVISVKPFEETLGAGGAILKHKQDGDSIFWLALTKPEESKWSQKELSLKQKEIDGVCKLYGFEDTRRLNYLQGALSMAAQGEMIDILKGNLEIIKPDYIYLPMGNDFLQDHKVAFEATFKALKSLRHKVKKILCYEIPSSFDFRVETFKPNVFVDISEQMDKKTDAMKLYESELEGYPQPQSVESVKALAKVYGASIGTEYAEAFMLIRELG